MKQTCMLQEFFFLFFFIFMSSNVKSQPLITALQLQAQCEEWSSALYWPTQRGFFFSIQRGLTQVSLFHHINPEHFLFLFIPCAPLHSSVVRGFPVRHNGVICVAAVLLCISLFDLHVGWLSDAPVGVEIKRRRRRPSAQNSGAERRPDTIAHSSTQRTVSWRSSRRKNMVPRRPTH